MAECIQTSTPQLLLYHALHHFPPRCVSLARERLQHRRIERRWLGRAKCQVLCEDLEQLWLLGRPLLSS